MFRGELWGTSQPYRVSAGPSALLRLLAVTLALGGCGGIEFQGKVFDYMGLSGDRQQADVRMSERPPLLLPPNLHATASARYRASPSPPRARIGRPIPKSSRSRSPRTRQRKPARGRMRVDDPVTPMPASRRCSTRPSASSGATASDAAPVDDVPEPDPSDKRPEDKGKHELSLRQPVRRRRRCPMRSCLRLRTIRSIRPRPTATRVCPAARSPKNY